MTDGGVVNASVSAVSSAGQEMLHRELPALTAYLQEEKVAVNAVAVHGPSAAGLMREAPQGRTVLVDRHHKEVMEGKTNIRASKKRH